MPQPPSSQQPDAPFIELQSVDSTNNYARQLIHAASLPERQGLAQHGMAVFAHEQTAGKGQRGKVWASEKGNNIALSIIIKPASRRLTQQFELIACSALAIYDCFSKHAGDATTIKWPNDLYWQDRKAGGILIESVISSPVSGPAQWEWAVVGIGININQTGFPAYLPNPVSLKQITGKSFNTVLLAKEICQRLQHYLQLLTTAGFDGIADAYNAVLYKRNQPVKFRKGNRVFEAVVKKVTPAGRLILQHAIEEEVDFGELEWLL